jgi:hypothetical protein
MLSGGDHRRHVGTGRQSAIAAESRLRRCNRPPLPHYESRSVSRPARLTFPKRMLGEHLLTVREPRFPVIKVRRYSRKGTFSGMFGAEVHHIRSKPRMEGDNQKFRGFGLGIS